MSTGISWTTETWNPTTGCDRVSAGCDHCYAMTLAKRLKAMGQAKYQRDGDPRTSGPGFGLTTHADALDIPLRWRKPRKVFVNSMSDLFHKDVPNAFIHDVWTTMGATPRHTYQLLTKRPQRMAQFIGHEVERARMYWQGNAFCPWRVDDDGIEHYDPLPNVWLGTSVENQRYADLRIPHLLATPAAVRFLSVEPLLGPVDLGAYLRNRGERASLLESYDGSRIGWVIVGGESGPGARPMEREWAQDIVDVCRQYGVPVFVKQLGSVLGGKHHQDIETFPAGLQVREFPA